MRPPMGPTRRSACEAPLREARAPVGVCDGQLGVAGWVKLPGYSPCTELVACSSVAAAGKTR
jgi:hypothetical protein